MVPTAPQVQPRCENRLSCVERAQRARRPPVSVCGHHAMPPKKPLPEWTTSTDNLVSSVSSTLAVNTKDRAATVIQAQWRSHIAVMNYVKWKRSAIKIQAIVRGHKSRSQVTQLRQEEAAATKIQKLCRGRLARSNTIKVRRKEEKEEQERINAAVQEKSKIRKSIVVDEDDHAAFAHWLKHKMKVPKWLWKALLWLRSSRLVKAIRATLPRKPTRLFIFDISFDAIEHDPSYRKRRGFLGQVRATTLRLVACPACIPTTIRCMR